MDRRPERRPGMSAGDPGIPVRRQAVQRGGSPGRWRFDFSRGLIAVLFAMVLAGSVGFVAGALGPDPSPKPTPSGIAASPGASGSGGPSGNVLPSLPGDSSPSPSSSPTPSQSPVGPEDIDVPIVPVVGFWSTRSAITTAELRTALTGKGKTAVMVPSEDRDAIAETLGVKIAASVKSGTVGEIRAAVRTGALGLLRAADVTPAVHALGIDAKQLFGEKRIARVADWPLLITATEPADRAWRPASTWTIAAAGDILLDRGPARQVRILKKGVDFPFDGGTAEITGFRCCSGFGHPVPTYRRTGNRGAVRDLMQDADLAMANLESPIDNDFRYHDSGTLFQADPKMLRGLENAGLDHLSLANNHIGNAGSDGILETVAGLDKLGIGNSGAGKDPAAAIEPESYDVKGVKVGVIGCDAITREYWAGPGKPGANPCTAKTMVPAIKKAKTTHDLVIVYPHWGIEYRSTPVASQRDNARKWIAAGADLIIGNHPHWVQGMEEIDGKLVFYALGNFVFDQMWQEQTMEGMIIELTYTGTTLRQVRLHPTLVIDQAQPNLLEPAGDGQRVLKRMRAASKGLLPY